LDFEQDQKPLWERLAKAKAFADQVYQIEAKVSIRVTELITEIDSDNEAKPPFPRNLFTLSLQNIAHIFSAAIKPDAHHGETVAVQNAEAGTLSFYLRDLNVNQAIERLELLSKEVGFNPHSEKIEAINDIQGIIISQYRNLKSEFSKLIKQLADTKDTWQILVADLTDAPEDFWLGYADAKQKYESVEKKIKFADSLFDSVQEDADAIRGKLINDLRLGNFRGLQAQVPSLLDDVRLQINQLVSHVTSLKNYGIGYREKLLQTYNIHYEAGLNSLRKTKGKAAMSTLTVQDIMHKGSLNQAIVYLHSREQEAKDEIKALLDSDAISVERWTLIADYLQQGKDPELSTVEDNELISQGILVRTYRFAGE